MIFMIKKNILFWFLILVCYGCNLENQKFKKIETDLNLFIKSSSIEVESQVSIDSIYIYHKKEIPKGGFVSHNRSSFCLFTGTNFNDELNIYCVNKKDTIKFSSTRNTSIFSEKSTSIMYTIPIEKKYFGVLENKMNLVSYINNSFFYISDSVPSNENNFTNIRRSVMLIVVD